MPKPALIFDIRDPRVPRRVDNSPGAGLTGRCSVTRLIEQLRVAGEFKPNEIVEFVEIDEAGTFKWWIRTK